MVPCSIKSLLKTRRSASKEHVIRNQKKKNQGKKTSSSADIHHLEQAAALTRRDVRLAAAARMGGQALDAAVGQAIGQAVQLCEQVRARELMWAEG